jgi:hypothetical protein
MKFKYKILLDEKEKKERDGMQRELGKWQICQQLRLADPP